MLHKLPDVIHHLRAQVSGSAAWLGPQQQQLGGTALPTHLGGQVCRDRVGLPLQVLIQSLGTAQQGPRQTPLQRPGPLWPGQASKCLSCCLAHVFHVVEDHTELRACDSAW